MRTRILLFFGWMMITAVGTALANTPITTDSPIAFFTNVASRLLSAGLNVDLHRIQIYPTNQYTPAVNRLLQLAANIYDAADYTNHFADAGVNGSGIAFPRAYLPSVFRPIFNVVKIPAVMTNVSICGFTEVTNAFEFDAPLSLPWDISNPAVLDSLNPGIHNLPIAHDPLVDNLSPINVFGVPLIIGAKKGIADFNEGFPTFNEFYMESAFQLTRKMLVTRATTNSTVYLNPNDFSFYEMFNLSLTNSFGVECWNSYRSNYTRPTDIYVNDYLTMTLTNYGSVFSFPANLIASASAHLDSWQGYDPIANPLV